MLQTPLWEKNNPSFKLLGDKVLVKLIEMPTEVKMYEMLGKIMCPFKQHQDGLWYRRARWVCLMGEYQIKNLLMIVILWLNMSKLLSFSSKIMLLKFEVTMENIHTLEALPLDFWFMTLVLMTSTGEVVKAVMRPATILEKMWRRTPSCIQPWFNMVCFTWS